MKIKRFYAADMRQALRMVKDELGADAVILSNNSSGDGIEIVAAKDYDERAVQKAVDEKEAAFDAMLDKKLHEKPINYTPIDLQAPPKQDYRRDFSPKAKVNKRPVAAVQAIKEPPVQQQKQSAKKPQWHEDPAIKAVKEELSLMRHEFKTQLNELKWADSARQNPVRIDVIRRLLDTGFSKRLSLKLAESVDIESTLEQAWLSCLEAAGSSIPILENDILENGGVIALVGATGVGKTTSIAKIAARFRMRHGADQLALITTDNYRIGAHEQLNNFARILDVPMRVASTQEDLKEALDEFIDKRLVLIDTAGMSQKDLRMTEQFQLLNNQRFDIKSYLVISAATESRAMREALGTFREVQPEGCILTKLDETDCPGSALSAIIEQQIAIAFVSDGQRVPEDLHYPDRLELMSCFKEVSESAGEPDLALSVLLGEQSHHAYL